MTTLYRPVVIESAAQADALPEGTVVTHPESLPAELWRDPDDGVFGYGATTDVLDPDDLIGWTALVPIEAEEETVDQSTFAYPDHHVTRYTTPWEAS